MNKISFYIALVIAMIWSCFVGMWTYFHTNRQPSIIIMAIDTLRADHLGCYGYERPTSPVIDEFAKQSVLFENVLSQSPSTAPSFMTIFTSFVPPVHEIADQFHLENDRRRILCSGIPTLAEVLKKNNYITAGFYETGSLMGELGFGRGFDYYSDSAVSWDIVAKDPRTLEPLRQWIKRSKEAKKPLFLFLHHYICHDPYSRAPEIFRVPFVVKTGGLSLDAKSFYRSKSVETQSGNFWKNLDLKNSEHQKFVVGLYDSSVRYADFIFGRVLEMLKEEKIYDKSVILLLSDHGEEFGEHGGKTHGRLFIEALRVPLIIKFPGSRYAGIKISRTVRLMDLMPTLFDFLKIRISHFIQGISFFELFGKKAVFYQPLLVSYSPQLDRVRFSYRGFVYSKEPDGKRGEWLFDESVDLKETRNLAELDPSLLKTMRIMGDKILREDEVLRRTLGCKENRFFEIDDSLKERIKSLGYAQ